MSKKHRKFSFYHFIKKYGVIVFLTFIGISVVGFSVANLFYESRDSSVNVAPIKEDSDEIRATTTYIPTELFTIPEFPDFSISHHSDWVVSLSLNFNSESTDYIEVKRGENIIKLEINRPESDPIPPTCFTSDQNRNVSRAGKYFRVFDSDVSPTNFYYEPLRHYVTKDDTNFEEVFGQYLERFTNLLQPEPEKIDVCRVVTPQFLIPTRSTHQSDINSKRNGTVYFSIVLVNGSDYDSQSLSEMEELIQNISFAEDV